MKNTAIRICRKGVFLTSILAATVLTLFTACDSPSSSWEEPVHDYFDKYTNTAAIEKIDITCQSNKDNSGATCIPSDGNKTITFYLRNPRQYILHTDFSEPESSTDVQVVQDMQDKTIIRVTYSQSYLQAHEGGQQIGGTIYLTESETLREFDPYSFSLKCNSPPPGVKGQSVQTDGSHYIVCFYVPTTELGNATHGHEAHTVFISEEAVATIGTDVSITAKPGKSIFTTAPSGLAVIPDSGASAFTGSSTGCTAVYYDTGRNTSSGEFIRWGIYLEDEGGFKSKTVNADSIVTQVTPTITAGNDVLTCEDDSNQTTLTPSVDIGTIDSCSWSIVSSSTTAEGELTLEGNNATFTATTAGLATLKATIILAGGREVTATKTIRVLGLTIPTADEIMIVNEGDAAVSPTAVGFPATPTYTWHSSNPSVATVDASGNVHAVSNGNATITVEATYGGKTVTSNQKNIYVYKVGNITGDSIGFAGDGTNKNEMLLNLQIDKPSTEPSGVSTSQTWTSGTTTVAANPGVTTFANQRKVEPLKAGTTTISVDVSINCGSVSKSISSPRTKTLTIYGVSIAGNSMLSKTGSYNNLTLTPSLKSGTSTYSESETVTYSLSSSAQSIATTNDSAKKVTAVAAGEATITVTATIGSGANQKVTKATKKVNVIDVTGLTTFIAGEEARALTATTKPSDVTYTWSRTNVTGTATINSSTGKISATAKGNVTITLTANRTGSSSDKCEISKTISISEITLTGFPTEIAVGEEYECTYSFDPACSFTAGISSGTKVEAAFGSPNTKLYFEGKATGTETFTLKLTKDGTTIQYKLPTITVVSAHEVSINNLSTWLSNKPATTVDKPYKVKVTGLNSSNLSTLHAALNVLDSGGKNKYVDLSQTTLPNVTNMDECFKQCYRLVYPPAIPPTVTSMRQCFAACTHLKTAPTLPTGVTDLYMCFATTDIEAAPAIPSTVQNMQGCFGNCYKLKTPPSSLPDTVTDVSGCFSGCSALESAPVIPKNVTSMILCFNGCTSLSGNVTVKANITDGEAWGSAFMDCNNVNTVYVKSNSVKNCMKHEEDPIFNVGLPKSKFAVAP